MNQRTPGRENALRDAVRGRRLFTFLMTTAALACGAQPEDGVTEPVAQEQSSLCDLTFPNACSGGTAFWPNGVIPYEFQAGLPQENRNILLAGMNEWQANLEGVVTFRPRQSGDAIWVVFANVPGCGGAAPFPSLNCGKLSGTTPADIVVTGHTLHELGHAIAFDHEQNRFDRDRYIVTSDISYLQTLPECNPPGGGTVSWEPVTKCAANAPPTPSGGPGGTFGVFDFNSIMLYSSTGGFTPTTCALAGQPGGDWFRRMVKRGFSTTGSPPCPADINVNADVTRITAHDSSNAIEMFRTRNGWAPFTSMARDVGSLQPLDFALAPGVYAHGSPAVTSLGGSKIMTVVRGSNGSVYAAITDDATPTAVWTNIGTPAPVLLGDPAAVSWSQSTARVDVVIVGSATITANPKVWKKAYVSGTWESVWENSMSQPAAAILKGGIAIASWAPNRLDIFANDFNGRLWHQSWNPNWGGWDQPGGQCPGGSIGRPAAVSWGPDRIDIVVRAADNGIWQFWWDNGWAPQWIRIKSVNSGAYNPTIASYGPSHLEVFTGGSLNRLYQLACTSGSCKSASSWWGWVPFGGVLTSSPAASSPRGIARVDIVAASDDGSALPTPTSNRGLWHKWWPWQ